MPLFSFRPVAAVSALCWIVVCFLPGSSFAQQQQQPAGIAIDAQGVINGVIHSDVTGQLARKRLEAAAARHLPADVNRPSPLRMVSLVRLEAACDELARQGQDIPVEMKYLAGLQRLEYVFVFPEENDIVIAGPAEGFAPEVGSRMVGVSSGRPALRLDDLVMALRAVERGEGRIGCSFDPVPERMAAFQRWVAANNNPVPPAAARDRYQQMAQILGMQDVRLWGVPPESHFARVLVEADYRMKRLSLGLDQPPVRRFQSHLSMLTASGNSTQRWWFTPLYDAFVKDEDGTAFRFAGQRAQLLSQEEVTDAAGRRSDAAFTRLTTQKWSKHMTDKFPELADAIPGFAELQNVIDLTVLAALLKKERLPQRVGWTVSRFLDTEWANFDPGPAPRQVPTVANYRMANSRLFLGLVGGGVAINPMRTVNSLQFTSDEGTRIGTTRSKARNPSEERAWWWDASS